MIVSVTEAKTQLAKLIQLAVEGQKIVISENNIPLVELKAHQPKGGIKLGLLADTNFNLPDLQTDDDLINSFYEADIEP